MVNTNRRIRKLITDFLVIIFLPVLVFPVYFFISAVLDWVAGDAYVFISFLYDSKGQVVREFLETWKNSLPESFCFAWVLFLFMHLFSSHKTFWKLFSGILVGLIVGFTAGKYLYGSYTTGLLVASMTGAFLAGSILLIKRLRS